MNSFYIFAHGPIHRLTVPDICNVDDDLYEVIHRAAAFLDELPDVLHHFASLFGGVMAADVAGRIQILRALPA